MYYFASDLHLGFDLRRGAAMSSARRERLFVQWLDRVAEDAEAIFLVGDIFDFWFEFGAVVPQGFTRLLGRLGELTDRGVRIHFFAGNHDMWLRGYLERECGIVVHTGPEVFELHGRRVFVAHGHDMEMRKRLKERVIRGCFRSRLLQWVGRHVVHPDLLVNLGRSWARKHRLAEETGIKAHEFCGDDEPLVKFARRKTDENIDYFVFGHLHCARIHDMGSAGRLVLLGDWLTQMTWAEMGPDGEIKLRKL